MYVGVGGTRVCLCVTVYVWVRLCVWCVFVCEREAARVGRVCVCHV